ncbi:TPA: DNA-binding protein [Pseudomonas aeruginosa]|nr:DNA-binding protein [Pseudomonas aeruginosa]
MGRHVVPEYSDEKIVSTGLSLIKPGARPRSVSAYKIQKALKGGNYGRLVRVWGNYLDSLSAGDEAAEIPAGMQAKLDVIAADLQVKVQALVGEAYADLVSQFQRREEALRSELEEKISFHQQQADDALQVCDELEAKLVAASGALEVMVSAKEELSAEVRRLTEQLQESSSVVNQLSTDREVLVGTVEDVRQELATAVSDLQSSRLLEATITGRLETLENVHREFLAAADLHAGERRRLEASVARHEAYRAASDALLLANGIQPPGWAEVDS